MGSYALPCLQGTHADDVCRTLGLLQPGGEREESSKEGGANCLGLFDWTMARMAARTGCHVAAT
eukprot:2006581-Rhodomonas_salina.3